MKSSLEELRARARSVEAGLEEWDALLRELSRTPGADEDSRSRAELLRLIIEDPWLGGFQGSDGRRVDRTAVQALRALGEPYASESFPWLQEDLAHPGSPSAAPAPQVTEPNPGVLGRALAVVVGGIELLLVLSFASLQDLGLPLVTAGVIVCSLFLPAFLPRAPRYSPLDLLRRFGLVSLAVVTAGWSFLTLGALFLSSHGDPEFLGMVIIVLAIVLAHVMILVSLSRVPSLEPPPPPPASDPRDA